MNKLSLQLLSIASLGSAQHNFFFEEPMMESVDYYSVHPSHWDTFPDYDGPFIHDMKHEMVEEIMR